MATPLLRRLVERLQSQITPANVVTGMPEEVLPVGTEFVDARKVWWNALPAGITLSFPGRFPVARGAFFYHTYSDMGTKQGVAIRVRIDNFGNLLFQFEEMAKDEDEDVPIRQVYLIRRMEPYPFVLGYLCNPFYDTLQTELACSWQESALAPISSDRPLATVQWITDGMMRITRIFTSGPIWEFERDMYSSHFAVHRLSPTLATDVTIVKEPVREPVNKKLETKIITDLDNELIYLRRQVAQLKVQLLKLQLANEHDWVVLEAEKV